MVAGGAQWAARSAHTLARRLRRARRAELGCTRAQALARRAKAFRASLQWHWQLTDALGGHFATMGEAVRAARLVGLESVEEAEEAQRVGNWARHAGPPGAGLVPASPLGIAVVALEEWRQELYHSGRGCSAAAMLAAEQDDDMVVAVAGPVAGFGDAAQRFVRAVANAVAAEEEALVRASCWCGPGAGARFDEAVAAAVRQGENEYENENEGVLEQLCEVEVTAEAKWRRSLVWTAPSTGKPAACGSARAGGSLGLEALAAASRAAFGGRHSIFG